MFGLLPAWTEQERQLSLEGAVKEFLNSEPTNADTWLGLINKRLLAADRSVSDVIFPARLEEMVRAKIKVRRKVYILYQNCDLAVRSTGPIPSGTTRRASTRLRCMHDLSWLMFYPVFILFLAIFSVLPFFAAPLSSPNAFAVVQDLLDQIDANENLKRQVLYFQVRLSLICHKRIFLSFFY